MLQILIHLFWIEQKKVCFPLSYLKQYSENYILSGGIKDFSTYYTANYSLAKFDESLNSQNYFFYA